MRRVLRAPNARRLFLASCVARLPLGAMGLLFVLQTKHLTGSYTASGIASGAYALGLGVSNPLLARIVDARGQTAVLRAGAAASAAAVVAYAALPVGTSLGVIVVCTALAGMLQPPIGACMRALWPLLLADGAQRRAAYALESIAMEVVYIFGPVVVVAGIGSWSLRAATVFCALALLTGDLLFSAHPVSRGWRPHEERTRSAAGALRAPAVRLLIAVFALCGLAVGAVEVAVPAALDAEGQRGLTGLVLAAWGIGSMAGGFVAARFAAAVGGPGRLALLAGAWGVAHAVVGVASGPAAFTALLLVAGATIAPTFVCVNGMLDHLALPGTLTEAFTWTSTGLTAGIALGSAVAGSLAQAADPGLALVVLGAGGVLAALLIRLGPGRVLLPDRATAAAPAG